MSLRAVFVSLPLWVSACAGGATPAPEAPPVVPDDLPTHRAFFRRTFTVPAPWMNGDVELWMVNWTHDAVRGRLRVWPPPGDSETTRKRVRTGLRRTLRRRHATPGPADVQAFVAREAERWAPVVRASGATPG